MVSFVLPMLSYRALLDAKKLAVDADPPVYDTLYKEAASATLPSVAAHGVSSADSPKSGTNM